MNEKIEKLIDILKKHGAKRIKIFGSYARGEERERTAISM